MFFDTNISIYLQGSSCILWLGACAKWWEVGRSPQQNHGAIECLLLGTKPCWLERWACSCATWAVTLPWPV